MDIFQQNHSGTWLMVWKLSLVSFLLAALTGFFYRLGLLINLPEALDLANLRHAHSHLMFFNWICPPLMVFMFQAVKRPLSRSAGRSLSLCIYSMIGLGFLSYPFFLLYGYRPVAVGSAEIPLAAVISGLIMLTWYWFALLYFRQRKGAVKNLATLLFDISLVALIISSMGAWAVSAAQFASGAGALLTSAFTGFFLSVFTEGWVILGVMGVLITLYDHKLPDQALSSGWYYVPVLFGSMLLFPFSLSRSMLTDGMLVWAWIGLVLAVAGLLIYLHLVSGALAQSGFTGKAILVFISLKVLFMLAAVIPEGPWPGEHGVRILYLHTVLLGLASSVIIEAFHWKKQKPVRIAFILSVFLILGTLAMISGYWPVRFVPPTLFYWVLAAAALPLLPAGILLAKAFEPINNHKKAAI